MSITGSKSFPFCTAYRKLTIELTRGIGLTATALVIENYLELLRLLDPDLDFGNVTESGPTEESNLLFLSQVLGFLGVQFFIIHTLCKK